MAGIGEAINLTMERYLDNQGIETKQIGSQLQLN